MKLSLVTPPSAVWSHLIGDRGFEKDRKKKRHKDLGYLPSLGIGYLASAAINAGHEVQLIDGYATQISDEEVVELIVGFKPDVVGISATTPERAESYALARHLKSLMDVNIIMGGPHATVYPDDPLTSCPQIDSVGIGEGETIIADYLAALRDGTGLAKVRGLQWRDGGRIVQNEPVIMETNLDRIAHPAWQLYDFSVYNPLPSQNRRLPASSMMTSRGCSWGKCRYCQTAGRFGYRYRRRSPRDAIAEIRTLYDKYGIREISFRDDNFAVGPRWMEEFCDLLKSERIDITWYCQGIVHTVTRDMLKRMAGAGCFQIMFGFESGNEELLRVIHKGTTLDQARNAVKWCHEAGIEVRGNFMLGLPTETPKTGRESVTFAIELDLDYVFFVNYKPQFGTPLYEVAKANGTITTENQFFSGNIEACDYIPQAYGSLAAVSKMLVWAYRKFYYRPRFILKHLLKMFSSPASFKRYASHMVQFTRLVGLYSGYAKRQAAIDKAGAGEKTSSKSAVA